MRSVLTDRLRHQQLTETRLRRAEDAVAWLGAVQAQDYHGAKWAIGRYFQSHGPATVRDFAWWSGLTMKEAATGAAAVRADVLRAPPTPDRVRGASYLLPNYDEYLIAYKDRSAVIAPGRARHLGVFTTLEHPHHVIIDARVAGSWRRTITPHPLTIDVTTYDRARPVEMRALTRQANRYAEFLGLELDLRINIAAADPSTRRAKTRRGEFL